MFDQVSLVHDILLLLRSRNLSVSLPSPAGKAHPSIERSGPTFTAAAGFEADSVSRAFDEVAESNLLITDEAWQTHSMARVFGLFQNVSLLLFFLHRTFPLLHVSLPWLDIPPTRSVMAARP
jgi:hypothetical protein